MKKKILATIAVGLICVSAAGCGKLYQELIDSNKVNETTMTDRYFTEIAEYGGGIYTIVYANDTKVKYLIFESYYKFGITPLYNADGTLQIYDGE